MARLQRNLFSSASAWLTLVLALLLSAAWESRAPAARAGFAAELDAGPAHPREPDSLILRENLFSQRLALDAGTQSRVAALRDEPWLIPPPRTAYAQAGLPGAGLSIAGRCVTNYPLRGPPPANAAAHAPASARIA